MHRTGANQQVTGREIVVKSAQRFRRQVVNAGDRSPVNASDGVSRTGCNEHTVEGIAQPRSARCVGADEVAGNQRLISLLDIDAVGGVLDESVILDDRVGRRGGHIGQEDAAAGVVGDQIPRCCRGAADDVAGTGTQQDAGCSNCRKREGLLGSVTWRQQIAGGAWTTIRQALYTYGDGTQPYANAGDLMQVTINDGNVNNVLDTSYFRYYTDAVSRCSNVRFAKGCVCRARGESGKGPTRKRGRRGLGQN
jgi:hypothetical protein